MTPAEAGDLSVEAGDHQAGSNTATALNRQVVDLAGGNGASNRAAGHRTLSAGENTPGWNWAGGTIGRRLAIVTFVSAQ